MYIVMVETTPFKQYHLYCNLILRLLNGKSTIDVVTTDKIRPRKRFVTRI